MDNDKDAVSHVAPLGEHLAARGTSPPGANPPGTSESSASQPPAAPRPSGETPTGERVLRSVDLMAGEREVRIEHSGEFYRLRVTRQGKLILYK